MHYSDDENNFRNRVYLDKCKEAQKNFIRSFHIYMAYRNKLTKELKRKEEEKLELEIYDKKVANNVLRSFRLIKISDIIDKTGNESLKKYEEEKIIKEFYNKD